MHFLPLKIDLSSLLPVTASMSSSFFPRPSPQQDWWSSSSASRTCVVPVNTGSSPHQAESATTGIQHGGRRPGASTPHIRRVTRDSCERTTWENTKLQRRGGLFRTVSHTCRDINTNMKRKSLVQFAYAFTRTVPAHTCTQVAINTSTSAHTQGTNSNIDPLCVC